MVRVALKGRYKQRLRLLEAALLDALIREIRSTPDAARLSL
jgi:hypothetical protein